MSDAMEQLRDANPVPRGLSAGWSRTDEGLAARDGSTRFERSRRSRVPAALAAAALVVAIVASVALLGRDAGDDRSPLAASTIDRLADGEWSRLPSLPWGGPVTPIWTGHELIVWGAERGAELVDGRWRSLPDWGFGNRFGATVRWTGKELLVWGGLDPRVDADVVWGAAYDPRTRTWRALSSSPVPQGADATATWTGRVLVVTSAIPSGPAGASYDPRTDRWQTLPAASPSPSPQGNASARAAWNGNEVQFTMVDEGRAQAVSYDPMSDRWVGNPPFTATAYGPNDLVASGTAVLQVIWRDRPAREGVLEVARRQPRNGGSEEYPHPSICGVRTTHVPGGAVISCSTAELSAIHPTLGPLVHLPKPPIPVGELVWTKAGLVGISEGGRVLRLS